MSAEETVPPPQLPDPGPPERAELGVLFVHGIGSQRRGDTLIQCGDVIYDWLRRWLTVGPFGEIAVEPADTLLASGADTGPARSRLIFRRGAEVSRTSWLLAESCWAEVFRPPSYREFVRWAFRVVPFAVILHLVPRFRRAWSLWQDLQKSLDTRQVSAAALSDLEYELGRPVPTPVPQGLLYFVMYRMVGRVLFCGLILAPLAMLGLAMQFLLLAVMLVALVPLGFLRSFASRVQQVLTAAIGDSYLFLMSPVTSAAVVTQVQQDLAWLARHSDRVCIVAHSQGAAVAYRALQQLSVKGALPGNLKLLLTYGSGLRKLFDLERASRNAGLWTFYGVVVLALSVGASLSLGAAIFGVLGLQHTIHIAFCLLGTAICIVILTGGLLAASGLVKRPADAKKDDGQDDSERRKQRLEAEQREARHLAENDPELLEIEWDDFYASHDPVSNGPIAVRAPLRPEPTALHQMMDYVAVEAFRRRQRQVINRRSTASDHTSYWSSKDDFVARVVTRIARIADVPIELTSDKFWLDISAARRLWRVRLLSGCRTAMALAVLCVVLWGFGSGYEVLLDVGAHVPMLPAAATRLLPEWARGIPFPPWSLGAAVLVAGLGGMFAVARFGWGTWERNEFSLFFYRLPYRSVGVGPVVFALGWFGIIAIVPVLATLTSDTPLDLLRSAWWLPSFLLAVGAWNVVKAGRPPGTRERYARAAIENGERLLAETADDDFDTLNEARFSFTLSQRLLKDGPPSDERVRAALGEAKAYERMAASKPQVRAEAIASYEKAIETLKGLDRDTTEVQLALQMARLALRQTPPPSSPDKPST